VVTTAKNFVGNLSSSRNIANNYLLTFNNHDPTRSSSIVSSARTTPTKSLYLESIYSVS
jgi:hypothetical protein